MKPFVTAVVLIIAFISAFMTMMTSTPVAAIARNTILRDKALKSGDEQQAYYGTNYPITLTSFVDPKSKDKKAIESQQWIFDYNNNTGITFWNSVVNDNLPCETFGGVGYMHEITLWGVRYQHANFNYTFHVIENSSSSSSSSSYPLAQVRQSGFCIGFQNPQGSDVLLYTMECEVFDPQTNETIANPNATWKVVEMTKLDESKTRVQLCTLDQKSCIGLPLPYTQLGTIKNENFNVQVSVKGFGKDSNVTYLSNFQMKQEKFYEINNDASKDVDKMTTNLMDWNHVLDKSYFSTSGVLTLENDGTTKWHYATNGEIDSSPSNDNRLIVKNIEIGDFATETWTLTLSSDDKSSFTWTIDRVFTKDVPNFLASREATFIMQSIGTTVGSSNIPANKQAQIISTLDKTAVRNTTAHSGFALPIPMAPNGQWTATSSQLDENFLHFSPSDICASWKLVEEETSDDDNKSQQQPSSKFSFQWPRPEGTNPPLIGNGGFGILSSNRNSSQSNYDTYFIKKGSKKSTSFTLTINTDSANNLCKTSIGDLQMTTNNKTRDALLSSMFQNFNMFSFNWIGNSPFNVICLFEVGLHQQIMSTTANKKLSETMKNFYEMMFEFDVIRNNTKYPFISPTGPESYLSNFIISEWTEKGYFNYPAMYQSVTQLLLGFYEYIVHTGDREFAVKYWKDNGLLQRALGFLLSDDDGMQMMKLKLPVTQSKGCGDNPNVCDWGTGDLYANQSTHWFDAIAMGGNVAIISAEAIQVVHGYSDLAKWLSTTISSNNINNNLSPSEQQDAAELAKDLDQLYNDSIVAYNDLFWNESQGLYCDWVGLSGNRVCVGYGWTQALSLDPIVGAVGTNKTRAKLILDTIDERTAEIEKEYNITDPDYLWNPPTNYWPVPIENQVVLQAWSTYENGGAFSNTYSLEVLMRFLGGQPERGLQMIDRFLLEYKTNRAWGQHYSRPFAEGYQPGDQGSWEGADVLTDTNWMIYSLFRGVFSIRRTLTNGIFVDRKIDSPDHFKSFAGFSWKLFYMGDVATATVQENGEVNIVVENNNNNANGGDGDFGKYLGIGLAILLALIVVVLVAFKKLEAKQKSVTQEEENDAEKEQNGLLQQEGKYGSTAEA